MQSTSEHTLRTMRSPATQVSLNEKLGLAEAMLSAGDSCVFPERVQFLLDWICNALRAKGSDTPPRLNPRLWNLLVHLLQTSREGDHSHDSNAPTNCMAGQGQTPSTACPLLIGRLAQSSRLLLQAAASALAESAAASEVGMHGLTGSTDMLLLASPVSNALHYLLCVHCTWFRPGVEAITEYAIQVAAVPAQPHSP